MIRQFGHILGDGAVPVWTQLPFPIKRVQPKTDGSSDVCLFSGGCLLDRG
jgi:hypothetical protein